MKIVTHILDPPLVVFVIFLLLILIVLRKYLRKDHFYTILISSLLSFLLVEVTCRLTSIGNFEVMTPVWEEELAEEADRYPYKPNSKLLYHYPDNPRGYFGENNEILGTVNSKGFRGLEKGFQKPDGLTRVVFLGDSFTLGIGVKDEDTIPVTFENVIKAKYGDIEVLNFGISGSSTKQQITLLEEYVIGFAPDIVIIVLFLNDANRIGTIKFLSRPHILTKVRNYSFFINFFVGSIEKYFLHKTMIRHYQKGFMEGSSGWEEIKTALRNGKSLSKKHGFQFIVAVYPVLIQLDEKYPFRNIHKTIGNYCESLKIPFADLFNGFVGKKGSDLWVHPTDQHPNEVANRLAAAELLKFFNNQDLITGDVE